jgi:predicted dehydrogenase
MVGGGEGAFIGGVHRMAARLDGHWDLAAGAFQSNAIRSAAFGRSLGLADDRCYGDFRAMAEAEAARADRIDAVSIVTPNHMHVEVAKAFAARGIAVICDKPLATSVGDAMALSEAARKSGAPVFVTYNYSGYPMVRQARAMVKAGELGKLRIVRAEYAQDWLAAELPGNKQADWRGDPARAGPGGALGDIATHAFHLAEFVSGQACVELSAELTTFVAGRRIDDDAQVRLRFVGEAKGGIWASQVATGAANGLKLSVFGDRGGLTWAQETPEELRFTPLGQPTYILRRGGTGLGADAQYAARLPAGHPEGYLEGFAQIYSDIAEQLQARLESRAPDARAMLTPTIEDGVRGVQFIATVIKSNAGSGAWTPFGTL